MVYGGDIMETLVDEIVQEIPDLPHSERVRIRTALDGVEDFKKVCDLIENKLEHKPECPYCGKSRIHKHGTSAGLLRYKCTGCNKTFNALTKTPLARMRKKELWLVYMQKMLESKVLRKIARELNIDKKTAFLWLHHFSTWLQKDTPKQLCGIVEADETYFRVSRKGCRNLKRPPRKHGGDQGKRGLSKEQVCVLTARDRSDHALEFVTGLGPVKGKWLDLVLSRRIVDDAVLVTDALRSYTHFCNTEHIAHVIVRNKPGLRASGCYHIQHINAFHERIKTWINRHFRGVATKYLNHYLWWRHELENKHITDALSLFRASIGRIPQLTGT